MKKLILHAGMHKTGTTAIQMALSQSRDVLRADRFLYPPLNTYIQGSARNHNLFGHAYGDRPEFEPHADRFARDLSLQAHDGDTVILSAESICRHLRGDASLPRLVRRRNYLQRVAEALSDFDVQVLLFFRRRDRFMESIFHERAANGSPNGSFDEFVAKHGHAADYALHMEAFRLVIGNLTVVSYESAAREGLLRCFSRVTGCPPLVARNDVVRQSTDARISLWMEHKRGQDGSDARKAKLRKSFSRSEGAKMLFSDFGNATLWREHQRRQFLEQFGEPVLPDSRTLATDESFDAIERAFRRWQSDRRRGREVDVSIPSGTTGLLRRLLNPRP